jgi:RNA polymerase sigma-70 factor (ECF subfamily)
MARVSSTMEHPASPATLNVTDRRYTRSHSAEVDHSDRELIQRVTAGDQQAVATLYERYATPAFSLALRVVGDRESAEEIVQEAFMRVWSHARSFDPQRGRFASWLLSIIHNLAVNELRRRRSRPQVAPGADELLGSLHEADPGPEEVAWAAARRRTIREALTQLPQPQRQAIELAFFRGLTQMEIAETLGHPLGTVKTRIRLGMQKLNHLLAAQGLSAEA